MYQMPLKDDPIFVCLSIGLAIAVLACNNKGEKLWVN